MATEYFKPEDFEKAALPKGFKMEVYEIVELAVLHGWTVAVTSNMSMSIIAPPPNERKKYHFSTNRRTSTPLQRVKRDILRFAKPELVAIGKAVAATPVGSDEGNALVDMMPSLITGSAKPVDMTVEPEPKPERRPRYVVSRTPMVAKAREGAAYDSPTTLERKWSDGTVDWECAHPGCDQGPEGRPWEATSRLSVSRHYAGAHSRGNGRSEPPPSYSADVPGAASYAPQQRRVDALAAVLAGLMGREGVTPEDMAREALTWVHDQSRRGTDLAAEREPLTDADILNRIRTLLDDGTLGRYQQQFDDLNDRIVQMENDFEMQQQALEAAFTEAEARRKEAAEAKETLRTFIELANELGKDDKEAS